MTAHDYRDILYCHTAPSLLQHLSPVYLNALCSFKSFIAILLGTIHLKNKWIELQSSLSLDSLLSIVNFKVLLSDALYYSCKYFASCCVCPICCSLCFMNEFYDCFLFSDCEIRNQ